MLKIFFILLIENKLKQIIFFLFNKIITMKE